MNIKKNAIKLTLLPITLYMAENMGMEISSDHDFKQAFNIELKTMRLSSDIIKKIACNIKNIDCFNVEYFEILITRNLKDLLLKFQGDLNAEIIELKKIINAKSKVISEEEAFKRETIFCFKNYPNYYEAIKNTIVEKINILYGKDKNNPKVIFSNLISNNKELEQAEKDFIQLIEIMNDIYIKNNIDKIIQNICNDKIGQQMQEGFLSEGDEEYNMGKYLKKQDDVLSENDPEEESPSCGDNISGDEDNVSGDDEYQKQYGLDGEICKVMTQNFSGAKVGKIPKNKNAPAKTDGFILKDDKKEEKNNNIAPKSEMLEENSDDSNEEDIDYDALLKKMMGNFK